MTFDESKKIKVGENFNFDDYKNKFALSKVDVNGYDFLDVVKIKEEIPRNSENRPRVSIQKVQILYSRGDIHSVKSYNMDLEDLILIDKDENPEYFL